MLLLLAALVLGLANAATNTVHGSHTNLNLVTLSVFEKATDSGATSPASCRGTASHESLWHAWELFLTGTPNASKTVAAVLPGEDDPVALKQCFLAKTGNSQCISIHQTSCGSTDATAGQCTNAVKWAPIAAAAPTATQIAAGTYADGAICADADGTGSNSKGATVGAPSPAVVAADGPFDKIAVTIGSAATVGTAANQATFRSANVSGGGALDLVVWLDKTKATCLAWGGDNAAMPSTWYNIACDSGVSTIFYWTDNACGTAAGTAKKALYAGTPKVATEITAFTATSNGMGIIYMKAQATDPCIELSKTPSTSPASAVNTAAAAAVLAAGALIL